MPAGSRGAPPSMVWPSGGDIGIDMRRVKARTDAIVAASRDGLTWAIENAANITLYRGHRSVRVAASSGNRR